ncbi:GIY-YIG nuclease family protein [Gramella sp. GC03-9]|uniref:GIY-YIG nuclease family protein n=1 Tax=Christiangramia oceanisediminis TaxID=2920386 RepID=A0A9X2I5N7_9FLAO|nr:GIY-YIG nuclease family protein [Gramella oceanisediminis]MCP9198339.1 GIY-YIG nuclease family protein [Gramella oceanisediminis]
MKLYFVYIVQCNDKSYYVGMTSNMEQRLNEHNSGKYPDAYTFSRRPVELKWIEQFTDPDIAMDWEKKLKGWSRKKKEALILNDWDRLIRLSKNYTQFGKPK